MKNWITLLSRRETVAILVVIVFLVSISIFLHIISLPLDWIIILFFSFFFFLSYIIRFFLNILKFESRNAILCILAAALCLMIGLKVDYTFYNVFVASFFSLFSLFVVHKIRIVNKGATTILYLTILNLILIFVPDSTLFKYFHTELKPWDQKINWNYFKGISNEKKKYESEIHCVLLSEPNKVYNYPQAIIIAGMYPNLSWKKDQIYGSEEELLKHEQYHFNIIELFRRRATDSLNHIYPAKVEEINQIIFFFKDKSEKCNDRYESESNHSLNKMEQQRWEKFIDRMLK